MVRFITSEELMVFDCVLISIFFVLVITELVVELYINRGNCTLELHNIKRNYTEPFAHYIYADGSRKNILRRSVRLASRKRVRYNKW